MHVSAPVKAGALTCIFFAIASSQSIANTDNTNRDKPFLK
jgi:hypothetical protein